MSSVTKRLPGALRGVCALTFAAAAPLPAEASVTSFFDGAFSTPYAITTFDAGVPTVISSGQTAGGNPGTALFSTYSQGPSATGTDLLVVAVNPAFSYDPGVQGAVAAINVSLDRWFAPMVNGVAASVGGYSLRPIIFQGGTLYEASFSLAGGDAGSIWHTLATSGLTAADFGTINPATPGLVDYSTHPNFAAGAMSFGFAMRASGAGPITLGASGEFRADNFAISVSSGVPEPSTWAMMLLGFAGLGLLARRKVARV